MASGAFQSHSEYKRLKKGLSVPVALLGLIAGNSSFASENPLKTNIKMIFLAGQGVDHNLKELPIKLITADIDWDNSYFSGFSLEKDYGSFASRFKAIEGHRVGAVQQGLEVVALKHHGLQDNSAEIAQFAKQQLTKLGYEDVFIGRANVQITDGLEASARRARYQIFNQFIDTHQPKYFLLAHTSNDQAESVLLGLARGSGARSLSGMALENNIYVRPLLKISRQTTEAACSEGGVEFWSDPHNDDLRFARVRTRKNVLPNLGIYPVPTSQWIHINQPVEHWAIYDAAGRALAFGDSNDIDVHELPDAVYLIDCYVQGELYRLRFIKSGFGE